MRRKENSTRRIWGRKSLSGMDFLTATNFPSSRDALHLHHGYTISLVEEGVLPMDFKGFKLNLKPGDFLILGPDVPHSFDFSAKDLGDCSYRTVFIKEEHLSVGLKAVLVNESSAISSFRDKAMWENYLSIQKGIEAGSKSDISVIISVSEKLLTHMPDFVLSRMPVKSPHIVTVKEYIKENFASAPSIEELANIVHISPFYLMRLFKEEVGLSPHAYINQLRINKAKEMIEKGTPLLQITYELGFTDQSHFSKTFLKITGVNPAHYELLHL
ncbi:AraC family transcriptional regulator [Synergistes jonesii]|uniref:AraC family transcriptional regulator n=1 Tax=Synergistes jonesii TaxID=2754 RepID=UPI0033328E99